MEGSQKEGLPVVPFKIVVMTLIAFQTLMHKECITRSWRDIEVAKKEEQWFSHQYRHCDCISKAHEAFSWGAEDTTSQACSSWDTKASNRLQEATCSCMCTYLEE